MVAQIDDKVDGYDYSYGLLSSDNVDVLS